MKYIVEVRLPKAKEKFFDICNYGDGKQSMVDMSLEDFELSKMPVILATIPPQDFGETCKELEIKIIHLKQEIQEARSEMLEGVYNDNTNKIVEFESAISILRTLSVSINKNEGEG